MLNRRLSAVHEFGGSAAHTWSPSSFEAFSSVAGDFRRFLCTSSSSSWGLSPFSFKTSPSSSSTFSESFYLLSDSSGSLSGFTVPVFFSECQVIVAGLNGLPLEPLLVAAPPLLPWIIWSSSRSHGPFLLLLSEPPRTLLIWECSYEVLYSSSFRRVSSKLFFAYRNYHSLSILLALSVAAIFKAASSAYFAVSSQLIFSVRSLYVPSSFP